MAYPVTGDPYSLGEERPPPTGGEHSSTEDESSSNDPLFTPTEPTTPEKRTPFTLQSSGDRDWNREFQSLIGEINHLAHLQATSDALDSSQLGLEKATKLRHLCVLFADTATAIGITIIKELFLPDSKKTIKPISKAMGIAGGVKYEHSSIFFKLSRDWLGIYGSDAMAMKSSEHELKGCMAYLDCRVGGLHTPLMALVRYRGYALVAQSILPISSATILYGSNDAAKHVYSKDKELNAKFEAAAQVINIKGHIVWNRTHTKNHFLHAPADVEGHKGSDGLYYVLDTARTFPPRLSATLNTDEIKKSYLYRHFRPEFVKLNPVALSSDAFSKFGQGDDQAENERDIAEATNRLHNQVIPSFCLYLDTRYTTSANPSATPKVLGGTDFSDDDDEDKDSCENWTEQDLSQLIAELHMHGINCHLLLHVYSKLKVPTAQKLVLTEACARTAKGIVEEKWRCLEALSEDEYIREALDFFNLIFSGSEEAVAYWEDMIKVELLERFAPANEAEATRISAPEFDLAQHIDAPLFFVRTAQLLGLNLNYEVISGRPLMSFSQPSLSSSASSESSTSISTSTTDLPTFDCDSAQLAARQFLRRGIAAGPLTISGVKALQARTKYIHRVSFEEGTALTRLALSKLKANQIRDAKHLLNAALQRFKHCWDVKPNDYRTLYNWALALATSAELQPNQLLASQLWKDVADKYSQALVLQPNDWKALSKWGTALCVQAHQTKNMQQSYDLLSLACAKLSLAASSMPRPHFATSYNAGNANLNFGRLVENLAINDKFKESAYRLMETAVGHFEAALKLRSHSVDAQRNLAITYACLARLSSAGAGREGFFRLTARAFQRALHLQPDAWEIYYGWGNALFRHASLHRDANKSSELILAIFADAASKYSAALKIVSSPSQSWDPLVNLGTVLSLLAKLCHRQSNAALQAPSYHMVGAQYILKTSAEIYFKKLIQLKAEVLSNDSLQSSAKRILAVLIKYGGEVRALAFQTSSELFALPQSNPRSPADSTTTSDFPPTSPSSTVFIKSIKKSQGSSAESPPPSAKSKSKTPLRASHPKVPKSPDSADSEGPAPAGATATASAASSPAERKASGHTRKRSNSTGSNVWKRLRSLSKIKKDKKEKDKFKEKEKPPKKSKANATTLPQSLPSSPPLTARPSTSPKPNLTKQKSLNQLEAFVLARTEGLYYDVEEMEALHEEKDRSKPSKKEKRKSDTAAKKEKRKSVDAKLPTLDMTYATKRKSTEIRSPTVEREEKTDKKLRRKSTDKVSGSASIDSPFSTSPSSTMLSPRDLKKSSEKLTKKDLKKSGSEPGENKRRSKELKNAALGTGVSPTLAAARTASKRAVNFNRNLDWRGGPVLFAHNANPITSETDIAMETVIGRSRAGVVLKVARSREEYACKWILKEYLGPKPMSVAVFDHPFIVPLKYMCHNDSKVLMLFGLIKGRPVLEVLKKPLDEFCVKFLAAQIVSAISYIQSGGFIYRDFKPENVLLTNSGNLCLTVYWGDTSFARATQAFLAPEVVYRQRFRRDSQESIGESEEDVLSVWWSVGILLLTFITGSNPFENMSSTKMEEKILWHQLTFPTTVSPLCLNFLHKLVDRDPAARLTDPQQLRSHPWFSDIDWTKLTRLEYPSPLVISGLTYKSLISNQSSADSGGGRGGLTSSSASTASTGSLSSTMWFQDEKIAQTLVAPEAANVLDGHTQVLSNGLLHSSEG